MAKIFLIILLSAFIFNTQLLAQIDEKALYKKKVNTYLKLKKNGSTIALLGGGVTLAGVIMVSTVEWQTQSTSTGTNITTSDPEGVWGLLCIVVGVPVSVTGLVLGKIGYSNAIKYQKKLSGLSMGVNFSPQQKGISLVYRF